MGKGKASQKTATSGDSNEENEVTKKCRNPYLKFVNHLAEVETGGVMSGLQSWLGFAGSMTGTGSSILNKSAKKNPWVKEERKQCQNKQKQPCTEFPVSSVPGCGTFLVKT